MYIDEIKLYAKNEKELESLIPTKIIYLWMEFGIEKMCRAHNDKWNKDK